MATLTQAQMAIIFTCAAGLLLVSLLYTMSTDSTKYDVTPYFGAYPTDNSSEAIAASDSHASYNVANSSATPIFSMAFVSQSIMDSIINFQTAFTQDTGNIITDTLSKLAAGFGLMVFLTIGIAIATFVTLFQALNLGWTVLNIFFSLPAPWNVVSGVIVGGTVGFGFVAMTALTLNIAMKIYRSVKTGDNI